jgi:long-chain-fatty-acid--[acyl-carrier-protein] ligase
VVPINFEEDAPWPTASLRLVITGAEKTPEDLFKTVAAHCPPIQIIEGYGITETSPVLTANKPGKPRAGVGYALDGISLAILETEDYLAKKFTCVAKFLDGKVNGAVGQTGIIAASGPNVFGAPEADPPRGYLGIPLTEKNPFLNFDDKWWYDTGDLGYLEADGSLHLAGRLKRFVKIAGEMISLVALETALKARVLEDGSLPWADGDNGPVLGVECYEVDGEKPILALVSAVDASLEEANSQLRNGGMPKIAKLTMVIDARSAFDQRWADQGTLPLLGTGKTDYASVKRVVAAAVAAEQKKAIAVSEP